MEALLPLSNSNKELQSNLHSSPYNGLETLPAYFKEHCNIFVKFKKSSKHTNYIQAYKHTIELLIEHIATNSLFNSGILEFIALSSPIHLFSHCVYVLKRPNKSNLAYQNSLTLLLYTLQPEKLSDIITSSVNNDLNSAIINTTQQSFIQNLCSLPDIIMNKLSHTLLMVESNKDYTQSPIYPTNFYQLVSEVIFMIISDNSDKTGVFISFIANIFNRISVFGHADIVARNLITFAESRMTNKFKKLDILKNIISNMMPNRLERLLESLYTLYYSNKLGESSFFSNILLNPASCPRLKTILIDIFITSKQYPITRINLSHNLIHYLCLECEHLLIQTLESILDAFTKESYLYSISSEQHQYICRVIILIIRYYTCKIDPGNATKILLKIKRETLMENTKDISMLKFPANFPRGSLLILVTGVIEKHLNTSRSEIQLAGKICGSMLVSWLNPNPDNKLSFEFPTSDPILEEFCSLLTSPHEKPSVIKPEESNMVNEVTESELANAKVLSDMQKMFDSAEPSEILLPFSKTSETADSDSDELQTLKLPYDQPTEKKRPLIEILSDSSDTEDMESYPSIMDAPSPGDVTPSIHGPFTLRECLEWFNGNVCNENPIEKKTKIEAALNKAEKLIRSSQDVKIWSLDLTKTLLFLSDQFNIDNFDALRLNSLVAICVFCPMETVKFLTSEFYRSNNVIMARVDILTCLNRSACELSHISESNFDLSSLKMPLPKPKEVKRESRVWENTINERLKAKTRVISTVSQRPKSVENTFGQVVGYFFYPLLYSYDQQVKCMDLLVKDHWLLSYVLKTLGSLIIYAQGTLALRNMNSALLDFIIAIKSIEFPLVKQGICFCILCILEVSPVFYLLPDLSSRLEEISQCLEEIYLHDTDEKTRQIASETRNQINIIYPIL